MTQTDRAVAERLTNRTRTPRLEESLQEVDALAPAGWPREVLRMAAATNNGALGPGSVAFRNLIAMAAEELGLPLAVVNAAIASRRAGPSLGPVDCPLSGRAA